MTRLWARLYLDRNRPSCSRCSFCPADTDKAPYCTARILDNMTIASPQWLQNHSSWMSIRPSISSVRRDQLYPALLWSTYACAFDLDTFGNETIRVKYEARAGESGEGLGQGKAELETSDLVITVADKAVATCRCHGRRTQKSLKSLLVSRPWSGCLQPAIPIRKIVVVSNLRSESSLLALKKG